MTTEIEDLLGLTEIAELYGVHKQTVNGWRRNSGFPAPKLTRAMGPLWDRRELVAWKKPENGDFRILQEDRQLIPCAHCGGILRPMTEDDIPHERSAPGGSLGRAELICTECASTTLFHLSYSPDRGIFVTTLW